MLAVNKYLEMNSTHSLFTITVILTEKGFKEVDKVTSAIFSYLKMLHTAGPNERIFNEIQEINQLNFKYKEEPQPMDNVQDLAEMMQIYPSDLTITGKMTFYFKPGRYTCILSLKFHFILCEIFFMGTM